MIVEEEGAVMGVNLEHPNVTKGTLLHSCARVMRSSQMTQKDLLLIAQFTIPERDGSG